MNGSPRCLNSRTFPNSVIDSSSSCSASFFLAKVMEPSQIFGVAEECHSSESGWTMYIGSPAGGSSDGDAAPSDDEHEDEDCYGNNQDESDDSMASDASSGPSHQLGHPFGGNGRVENPNPHGLALLKHQSEVKFCLETKTKKPLMEKQRAERKEVKEELVLVGQNPKTSVQSSSKVRKSIWMGKKN